jgi:L,D-peptidoglycan transpeptidase YkuD (ErfK/YbiS/YcfS/YnhG family)
MERANSTRSRGVRRGLVAAVGILAALAVACTLATRPVAAVAADPGSRTLASLESSVTTPVPLPSRMATTDGCQQLIVVTGSKLGATTGTVEVFDKVGDSWVGTLTVAARLGKRGLIDGTKRKAGDNATPTGIWAMPNYVFGTHVHLVSGSKMLYRRMDSKSWWSSKRGKTYNTWVEARHWTGEYIAGSPKAYEFALSIGYNARPNACVYGRGTGIFLHVGHPGLTAGCVEIPRAAMIRICRHLDRGKHPHFAIGTLRSGTPTSILAY